MPSIALVGIIIFAGFVCGEAAKKVKLPKVTGYILAGILLNPGLFNIIPQNFTQHTDIVTNIALSFITFSVGGTLLYSRIKKLGRTIIYITLCEAEFAFFAVVAGIIAAAPLLIHAPDATWTTTFIPVALLVGCLASPTDPSATLAVAHEYKAKGPVTSTIMGVAAFDDVLGIINYSLAVALAQALVTHKKLDLSSSLLKPAAVIFGGIALGAIFGLLLNLLTKYMEKETEGAFIVAITALLALCFGCATILGIDELLATMTMGIIVVNYNPKRDKIFRIIERYTEELIFVLFFTLSGMQLDFSVLLHYLPLVVFFILLRTAGKISGAITGAALSKASANVKKYVAGGLIPQGGIVVGLALIIKQNHQFDHISDIIISVILGATVIHELIGPISAETALKKAGEIKTHQ
ncbi:MAG TPA: cation:proton antiporter [Sedimentisphaerales bacterium]|nr:cation:proton antiporter [Sedimentisphaerales bacterium]